MYICRLFHRNQPSKQIDARLIASGAVTLGRDPAADWPLDDPEGLLSRIHCTLSVANGDLLVEDSSTNGTFVDGATRVAYGTAVPLASRQTVQFGSFLLLVDSWETVGIAADATMIHLPPALPLSAWEDTAPPLTQPHPDASILEAFCEGARLDVSTFSDEDPAELMRRLGAIYHQTILGLSALVAQRTQMKEAQDLDRTTVGADRNNPVKWTAPRRLAEDMLRERDGLFLNGEDAVRASFADVSAHLSAMAAGANATIAAVLGQLEPNALAQEAAAQGFSLRGRTGIQLAIHAERHRALCQGAAAEAFRVGYCGGAAIPPQVGLSRVE